MKAVQGKSRIMGRPNKFGFREKSQIVAFRVSKEMKEFTKTLDNPSNFMLDLLVKTNEYKRFLAEKREQDKQLRLF